MKADQIELVRQYVKGGLSLAIVLKIPGGKTVLHPITRVNYESGGYWAKCEECDFSLFSIVSNRLRVMVNGRYLPLFDSSGNTIIKGGPLNTYTAKYLTYNITRKEDMKIGSTVHRKGICFGILLNLSNYEDYIGVIKSANISKRVIDLTPFGSGEIPTQDEDIIFDVLVIEKAMDVYPQSIYLVPLKTMSELGFTIKEII